VNADYECEKFIDRNKGAGNLQLDWNATFNNWLRKANEFKPNTYNSSNYKPNSGIQLTTAVNASYPRNDPRHPDYEKNRLDEEYWAKVRQDRRDKLEERGLQCSMTDVNSV
jgi:hypothetical protein